jgi:outer membrane protein insertion porin family
LVGSAVIDEQNFDWTRIPRSWQDVVSGTAFRGAGQHFRLEAMPGTQFQRYLVSFTEPYLWDTPVLLGLNGSYFVRAYPNWTEQRLGGRVNLGYQLAPDLTIGGALRAESINISNPSVPTPQQLADVVGNNALYTARVNIVQDTRDSAFLPTQGRRISLAFEQGFGDFSYPRGELEATQYFLLRQRADGSGRHTLRIGGQLGISGSDTPIFENFFAGGYSTIRGFRFRGASPVDDGVIVGGRLMMLAGAEYMFPITADDMLRGVVFCDTGTVEQDIHITSSDYRVAVGAGLRISVPMMGPAPIALDFAVPLARAEDDQTQVLSFFVGVQY